MAAQSFEVEEGTFASINVTPLVDIMLVLLIIFMVTAKLIVSRTLPMDLPKAASGTEQQIVLAVGVMANGDLTVDKARVGSDEDLLSIARAAHAKTKDMRAVIQADTQVVHGRVVHVMDVLSQAGISKVAFGVTRAAKPAALGAELERGAP